MRKIEFIKRFKIEKRVENGVEKEYVKLYEEVGRHGETLIYWQEKEVFLKNFSIFADEGEIDIDKKDAQGLRIRDKYPEKMLKAWGLLNQ